MTRFLIENFDTPDNVKSVSFFVITPISYIYTNSQMRVVK